MTLTAEALEALYEALRRPVLYYATQPDVPRGQVLVAAQAQWCPEYIVIHPDDLEQVRQGLAADRRLVHLRDWQP